MRANNNLMLSGTLPDESCLSWLLKSSYIICDSNVVGFPIQYASAGFTDLFQAYPSECQHKKCGALVGIESIQASSPSIESCMQACGLSEEEVRRALGVLRARAECEVKQMVAVGTGSFITLNQTLKGKLLVVSVVLHDLRHPASDRPYALGFQHDLTGHISVEDLFKAAFDRADIGLQGRQMFLKECLDMLRKDDVLLHLHRSMEISCLAEATGSFSPVGSLSPSNSESSVTIRRRAPGQLSKRKRFGHLALVNDMSRSRLFSSDGYMQRLMQSGFIPGSFIARSRCNCNAKVIQADKDGVKYAAKCVAEGDGEYLSDVLEKEYEILKNLSHPSIVKAREIVIASSGSAMVMEFIPGHALCQSICSLSLQEGHDILSKVMNALVYLHIHHQIAHRDLKAENIMVNTQTDDTQVGGHTSVKLIDFGSARHKEASQTASLFCENVDGRILPPGYHAGCGDIFELDVFAVGLLFASILANRETFTSDVFHGLDLKLQLPGTSSITEEYVGAVLNLDPALRPKIDVAWQNLPAAECWLSEQSKTLPQMHTLESDQ